MIAFAKKMKVQLHKPTENAREGPSGDDVKTAVTVKPRIHSCLLSPPSVNKAN